MGENEHVEPQVDEEEMMQQLRQELKNLTVSDHLLFMMHSLSALAVDRMGLTEEAGSQRDLDQARLAVDAYKALLEVVQNARPQEEMVGHRSVLSQLQMSYVEVLNRGETGAPSSGEAEEPSPDDSDESPSGTSKKRPSGEASDEPPGNSSDTAGEVENDTQAEAAAEAPADGPEAEE